jgi:hypothetical protein
MVTEESTMAGRDGGVKDRRVQDVVTEIGRLIGEEIKLWSTLEASSSGAGAKVT